LAKRREVLDQSCLFCSERESICHLFFDCCVAKCCWSTISELLNSREVVNFEYVAARWVAIASKKHELYNIISSAVLLCLWKFRNSLCYQGAIWLGKRSVSY
jgi:GH24 family phage-related lysozyme (muramidase)